MTGARPSAVRWELRLVPRSAAWSVGYVEFGTEKIVNTVASRAHRGHSGAPPIRYYAHSTRSVCAYCYFPLQLYRNPTYTHLCTP